jgi:excisionase family DNA binding protein
MHPPSTAPEWPGSDVAAPDWCPPEGTAPDRTEVRLGSPFLYSYGDEDDESWAQPFVAGMFLRRTHRIVFLERLTRMGSMALNELGKMLTAAEVAEMLHLHVNTVKRLGDRGELKYYRVCKRGDRRFLLEDVRRFLDNNR